MKKKKKVIKKKTTAVQTQKTSEVHYKPGPHKLENELSRVACALEKLVKLRIIELAGQGVTVKEETLLHGGKQ